jgi:hypothetical protein
MEPRASLAASGDPSAKHARADPTFSEAESLSRLVVEALPSRPRRASELVLVPFAGPPSLLAAVLLPILARSPRPRVVAVTSSWAEARAARAALVGLAIEQGDPHHLSDRWHDAAAAVVAPRTLDTLARPGEAMVDWGWCLRAGGVLGLTHTRPLPHLPPTLRSVDEGLEPQVPGLDRAGGDTRWIVARDERRAHFD